LIDNGFTFSFNNNNIFLKKNGLNIRIETEEEFFIINEVFIENVYKIESNDDYIVCDIGMNVGITSLYFSQFENIKLIYGFEPLKPTFECAAHNFSLNKEHIAKIVPYNYGLSNADKTLLINYDPNNKGNVGIKNMHRILKEESSKEKIELKDASKALLEIISSHPSEKFLVKIDCEGSEYDIIENFESEAILRSVNIFIIEWHNMENHKVRVANMIQSFKNNNFLVVGPGDLDKVGGMIYCFANN
jgi:FkbM family methyltransferase